MSDRYSFVTEYISCPQCLEAAKKVLIGRGRMICSIQIPGWDSTGDPLPIIAGKLGVIDEVELDLFIDEVSEEVGKALCHPLRLVVVTDRDVEMTTFSKLEIG